MYILLIILFITLGLFVWDKYPPDVVALMSMLALFLTGILDLTETLSGFSNPTVIMIAALFIIGEGLSRTGWTALAGQKFVAMAAKSTNKLLILLTLGSGLLSGFVSNTGAVAALMPMTVSAAWNAGTLPSKMLIPMAYGSNTGGLLTLTGTPPNIIVSDALTQRGLEGFSFFEFSLIGVPLLIITLLYFRFFGHKLLPSREAAAKPVNIDSEMHKWIEHFSIGDNLYRLRIRSMSQLLNTRIKDWNLEEKYNVSIVRLRRRHPNPFKGIQPYVEFPVQETTLLYHDILTVKGSAEAVDKLMLLFNLAILPFPPDEKALKDELINQEVGMAEMFVTPGSRMVGQDVGIGRYLQNNNIQLLGANRGSNVLKDQNFKLQAGDALLVRGSWENIESLKAMHENLVIVGSPESMSKDVDVLSPKSYIAMGALVVMILLLVLDVFPGAVAALICAGVVMLTGCVPITKAYSNISWTSVVMIAAMIPMGAALQKTGLARITAGALVDSLGQIHPTALLAGFFLVTSLFSQAISNSATAILMAPIALIASTTLDVSPAPFLITVAVSASTACLTPVATPTNAMVMSAGNYKFFDYFKVGGPLLLLLFATTILLVPLIWPY
ncbi:SLC13 family permease [Salegentibacter sp. F188]|uniref:SLC13 family permease n=1 Tax=Autumnicola patrickiae TaxID=3075591 RepID=A0ABU3E6Y5_9FLAO|nr:SLC13 family permease [Salegentibacter sp. F188]MDT0690987.1 SLC13 family permease [Salegentibacter sp. F188]